MKSNKSRSNHICFYGCSNDRINKSCGFTLNPEALNITIAEFANTVHPDETAHNEPFMFKVFRNLADVILLSAFLALCGLKEHQQVTRFF